MYKSNKYLHCLLMFVLLTSGTALYGDNSPPPPDAAAETLPLYVDTTAANPLPGQINVIFNITPRQDNGKLYFDVETNLPDGMLFMSVIRDEMGVISNIGSTMERLREETANGRIAMGPFPFEDKPFPPGEYTFYISSYPTKDQPKKVVAIIGDNGANLTGPDVIDGMVVFGQEFMITGSY